MSFEREGPFRIYKASNTHLLARRSASEYPLFVGQKGMFEPVQAYLRYRRITRNLKNGTVHADALILRRWLDFLEESRLSWTDASDELLENFISDRIKFVSAARVQTELNVIFNFYWVTQEKLGLVDHLVANPFEGELGYAYPISATISHYVRNDGRSVRRVQPQISLAAGKQGSLRPTPNEEQVETILEALLKSSKLGLGIARWLMASWMYRSTLRCAGVSGLTIDALAQALFDEGISFEGRPYDLAALAFNRSEQDQVKIALSRLAGSGRTEVFVKVREKRGKERFVPVALDFMELNLDYVWSDRVRLIEAMSRRRKFKGTRALFPSSKTGDHMLPNSISNLVNAPFRALKIPGSAHRLRAACCVKIVRMYYLKARAAHGRAWDPSSVLLLAAEAMGHARPKTLKPYLTRVQKEEELVPGAPVLVPEEHRELFEALSDAVASNPEFRSHLKGLIGRDTH